MKLLAGLLVALTGCKEGIKQSKDGAVLFQTTCVQCHGMDGRGTDYGRRINAPDFTSATTQSKSDAELMATIKHGRNQMQPWSGVYSDEQIRSLIAHIRTFKR